MLKKSADRVLIVCLNSVFCYKTGLFEITGILNNTDMSREENYSSLWWTLTLRWLQAQ